MSKKIVATVLAIVMLFTAVAVPAYADGEKDKAGLYSVLDNTVNALVGGIAAMITTPHSWVKLEDYVSENFYPGMSAAEYTHDAGQRAWSLGYSSASLRTGNELDGTHYVGGSLSVTKKLATDVRDDQRVRTVAVSDGRGITLFAVLDAYGLASTDVRNIRGIFAEYAKEKGLDINGINISTLHQHSCVDTFGMNGDLFAALFTSSFKNFFGIKLASGQNEEYMANLYTKVIDTMKLAVENMTEGTLSYGTVDVSQYIRDKRDPQVYDGNLNRLRFVPYDETVSETWLVNGAIHCVGNGAAGTVVTGDYPYYMEKYINETAGANFLYIQGAELAITSQGDSIVPDAELTEKYDERYGRLAAFGKRLGELVCSINNDTPIEPILNISYKEIIVPVENNILVLAAKGGLLLNKVVKTGFGKYSLITELGYAELGNSLAIAIMPGELAPEIAFGGVTTADESWTGDKWGYAPFAELTPGKKLLVFGLTNDQSGYILADNNWHSLFTENEEIVSAGKQTGSTVAAGYTELVKSVCQ